jgi:hypothetical protein
MLPKTGKVLPKEDRKAATGLPYAAIVAVALQMNSGTPLGPRSSCGGPAPPSAPLLRM